MSSSFSYELDEEQIRSTLQNSRALDYTESSWDDFEANYNQHTASPASTRFKLPEFNLNINRNLVLPALFIAGLVGISAIMLSFIDFKANEPQQVEKTLVPNPDNYKPGQTKAALLPKKEPEKVAEEPAKPVVNTQTVAQEAQKTIASQTNETARVTSSLATNTVVQAPVSTNTVTSGTLNSRPLSVTDTSSASNTSNPATINQVNQAYPGKTRKRRRKVPTEQIETIKAPSILGAETTEKEPELEIKMN